MAFKEGRAFSKLKDIDFISYKLFKLSKQSLIGLDFFDKVFSPSVPANTLIENMTAINDINKIYRDRINKDKSPIINIYKNKKGIPLKFAKVIYDWQTNDVFKFISEEHNAEYCSYYDVAAITDSNSRVGIPLHSVAIRRIGDVVATEPEFYDRLVEVFPYIDAQRLYWSSVDIDLIVNRYAKLGFDGASYFIDDYMIGDHKKSAYLNTGTWSDKAIKEAHFFGDVDVIEQIDDAPEQ